MPGGQLSYFIYQKLGGELSFGGFWTKLGLPTVAFIAFAFCMVDKAHTRMWAVCSASLIAFMAACVSARILY